jgi:hypothetical protein
MYLQHVYVGGNTSSFLPAPAGHRHAAPDGWNECTCGAERVGIAIALLPPIPAQCMIVRCPAETSARLHESLCTKFDIVNRYWNWASQCVEGLSRISPRSRYINVVCAICTDIVTGRSCWNPGKKKADLEKQRDLGEIS